MKPAATIAPACRKAAEAQLKTAVQRAAQTLIAAGEWFRSDHLKSEAEALCKAIATVDGFKMSEDGHICKDFSATHYSTWVDACKANNLI